MEKLLDEIICEIKLDDKTIKNYSMLSLAFLGDGVHSLFIREKLIERANFRVKTLHGDTTKFVKAKAQSIVLDEIFNMLLEDEKQIVKSSRNAKTNNIAKNASIEDYKKATAFESLIGYLSLKKDFDRLKLILNLSYDIINNKNN